MSEPIIYAYTNNGVFDTNDGTNYMINATSNDVLSSFGNVVTIQANAIAAGNSVSNVTISSNLVWIHVGNSIVNTWINSTAIVFANSTTNLQINIASTLGGGTSNVTTNTGVFDTSLTVGNSTVNVYVVPTSIRIGNSTVNVSINSTAFSGTVTPGASYVQNTDSRVLSGNLQFSGANVTFGNSTVFATVNSTIYSQTANNTLFVGAIAAGNVVSNGTSQSISGAKVWSNQQTYLLATVTDATNIAWDVSAAQKGKVTLAGNRTVSAVTSPVEGATYTLWVIQDSTGSRTLAWTTTGAGSFDFGTLGAPTLTTTASRADLLTFEAISIAGTLKLRFTGIMKGFA